MFPLEDGMVPEALQAKLRKLRGGLRALITLEGLARLLVILGLLVVLTFLFDWATPLPAILRLILTLFCAAILAVTFWRALVLPLAGRMTDDQVAIAAERRFPDLNDRLISSVQLARLGPDEGFFNSPEMVEALVRETEREVGQRAFRGVFSASSVARFCLLALLFVVLISGFAIAEPGTASFYVKRYLTPFSAPPWPRYNELTVVDPIQTIAKGDDVEIKVESVGKRHPSTVTVYSAPDPQGSREESLMLKYGTSSFKKMFENVNEAFWYYAKGGDARTQWYKIDVKIRPHIEELEIRLEFPEYTGVKDRSAKTGNVRVPVGTIVKFVAKSNNPLKRARLVGDGIEPLDGKNKWNREEIEREGGNTFSGGFVARKSSHYMFHLDDVHGFDNYRNHKPVTYNLRVLEDRPPVVRVLKPARNNMMTPNAVLPLSIEIKDEYGMKDALLKFYKMTESQQPEGAKEEVLAFTDSQGQPINVKGEREVAFNFNFNLEPVKAKIGDTVIYYVEARDFNDSSQRKPGRSRKWKISIVTAEELRKAYQDRLVRLKDRLKSIRRGQVISQSNVSDVSQEVALTGAVNKELQRKLLDAELDQHKTTRELEGSTEEFDDIIVGARANKLYSEPDYAIWSSLNVRLVDLAQRISPRVSESIYKLRKDKPEEGYEREFDSIYKMQAELINELNEIIKKLEEIADFNEIVLLWRKLVEIQRRVRDGIRKKLRQKGQVSFTAEEKELIEGLLDKLGYSSNSVRKRAVEELRKLTEQKFGFDPEGSPGSRKEALKRWEDWWKEKKKE
jgi:hypothetical protein